MEVSWWISTDRVKHETETIIYRDIINITCYQLSLFTTNYHKRYILHNWITYIIMWNVDVMQ